MPFRRTFAVDVLLLPVFVATVNLEFRCDRGNYVIKNPDTARYTGVNGYYENGTACDSTMTSMDEILTISDCGLERVQVDLLEGGSVGETAVISCADGERSMSGYTLPIDFVLKSSSLLRGGSAHYTCHASGIVLVKNPRPALYRHSVAYTMDQQPCVTEHKLENKLIEIYDCDVSSGVALITSSRPSSNMTFGINRQSNLFMMDCDIPPTLEPSVFDTDDDVLEYECYDDGSVVAKNPRVELFEHSYAEQNSQELTTVFIKNNREILIGNVDVRPLMISTAIVMSRRSVFYNHTVAGLTDTDWSNDSKLVKLVVNFKVVVWHAAYS